MLSVNQIYFSYHNKLILNNINFDVEQGKNIALIGESGSGKSTLLKLIYGIYDLDFGTISLDDNPIFGPKINLIAGNENIKYLAQDFDLMPYITVAENVGKYLSNIDLNKKKDRVLELLTMVEMEDYAHTKAQFLSGGQQQRVALAKALAVAPKLLLLDEPFSNIDSFRKGNLRRNLFSFLKNNNISCIVATHDSVDALSFSDEIIVLKNTKIVQHDNTKTVYNQPKNKYVGSLFGEINAVVYDSISNQKNKREGNILIYANELKVASKSDLKIIVKQSYFKGNHYLIEGNDGRNTIFFENPFEIKPSEIVFLKTDSKIVLTRNRFK